jgi:hypothetical protein
MKRRHFLFLGSLAAAAVACGALAWAVAFASPTALVPPDAAEVHVDHNSMSRYQVIYRAAHPLTEWRVDTIQQLTAAGWVRGRRPDSPTFDRSLWFVRRRTIAGFSMLEQLSIRAEDGPAPLVLLSYQRSFSSPALGWRFGFD